MKRIRIRPWVKNTFTFVVGVLIVAKITSAIDTYAIESENIGELKTVHGIVSMISDGQAHVRTVDGAYEIDIVLPLQKEYFPMVMVTIVLEGDTVVSHGLTGKDEEAAVIKRELDMVTVIRDGVFRSNYE